MNSRSIHSISNRRKNFFESRRKSANVTRNKQINRHHPSSPTLINETSLETDVLRHRVLQPTFFSVQFSLLPDSIIPRGIETIDPRKPAGNGSSKIFIALPEPPFCPGNSPPFFSPFLLLDLEEKEHNKQKQSRALTSRSERCLP